MLSDRTFRSSATFSSFSITSIISFALSIFFSFLADLDLSDAVSWDQDRYLSPVADEESQKSVPDGDIPAVDDPARLGPV